MTSHSPQASRSQQAGTALTPKLLAACTLVLLTALAATVRSTQADDHAIAPGTHVVCLGVGGDDCRTRLIRLPDGQPGQVLKFEFCHEGDCDRQHRERWSTHYLVPPAGEVCRNTDINEALHWLEQNQPGWLLAGWGCVSAKYVKIPV